MRLIKRLITAVLVIAALALAACSAVPGQLQATIKDLPKQIKTSRKAVDEAEKAYAESIKDTRFDFTRTYTPEQMRTNRFVTARVNLDEAEAVYENQVKPLEKNFKVEQTTALETQVSKVRDLIALAQTNAREPARWANFLLTVKDDSSRIVRDAEAAAARISQSYGTLKQKADKAEADFAHQKALILEKTAPFTELNTESQEAFKVLQAESVKSSPFYPAMADAADVIATNDKKFAETMPTYIGELDGLYVRETHTLIDIRVESVLSLERTSWDEGSDFGETDYEFPEVPVSLEVADYFAQFPAGTVIAAYNKGWGSEFKLTLKNVDQRMWDALKIDPGQEWPSSWHNSSEITMGELEETYCHKLKVFRNGKPDASERPASADDDACAKHTTQADIDNGIYWEESDKLLSEAIGMDIYAKAYGDFPEQAIEVATPPGISYVGDPSAGEWQTDSNGNSFWHYYGMYRFFGDMIGGPYPYYYRTQYDDWNRSHRRSGKPYYMPDAGGTPRFGGKSPQTVSRFPDSNYNRSGLREATVRNSGPVSRGGGPGGGGK